jgi:hypothetical protein
VRRLGLGVGESSPTPAACEHGFSAVLAYDRGGLVLDYPGIAERDA